MHYPSSSSERANKASTSPLQLFQTSLAESASRPSFDIAGQARCQSFSALEVSHPQSSTAQLWKAPLCNSKLFIIPLLSAQLCIHKLQISNEAKRWILGPRNVYFPRTCGFNPTASSEAAWSLFPRNCNTQFFTPCLIYCPQIWACVQVLSFDTLVLVVNIIWIDYQKMHICFTAKMKYKTYFQLHHFFSPVY